MQWVANGLSWQSDFIGTLLLQPEWDDHDEDDDDNDDDDDDDDGEMMMILIKASNVALCAIWVQEDCLQLFVRHLACGAIALQYNHKRCIATKWSALQL